MDAVRRLIGAFRRVASEKAGSDLEQEDACALFLHDLAAAADDLGVKAAGRSYRENFAPNYREMFPDEDRRYRVEILQACTEGHAVVWVNGNSHKFSDLLLELGGSLLRHWGEVTASLSAWDVDFDIFGHDFHLSESEWSHLTTTLERLDQAWAAFEGQYISELSFIEDEARQIVACAIDSEQRLQVAAAKTGANALRDALAEQRHFLALLSNISALADACSTRQWPSSPPDLTLQVLENAVDILAYTKQPWHPEWGACAARAARTISADIVSSFSSVRDYLRSVSGKLDEVQPELSDNAELVARLVQWEECLKLGSVYLSASVLRGFCEIVSQLQTVSAWSSTFATMCDSRDAELFLTVPRLTLLLFASDPSGQEWIIRGFLPQHYGPEGVDSSLKAMIQQFTETREMLQETVCSDPDGLAGTSTLDLLLGFAIDGLQSSEVFGRLLPRHRAHVKEFFGVLEFWSMGLQRECVQDWNELAGVMLRCLAGETRCQTGTDFLV